MGRIAKLLERIIQGRSDANIPFAELCNLLKQLGFSERIRGSHRICSLGGISEILNLQPKDHLAKPYQVKQVRELLVDNGLAEWPDTDENS